MESNNIVRADLRVCPLQQSILDKTHYGLKIYSHILRLYYPNEVVLRLIERDCGLCRNPFNSNKETLHIFIEKSDPTNTMSAELARHQDTTNAIPAGDAFSFAQLHYKQQGDELLQTINKDLCLRIGEVFNFYANRKATSPLIVPHIPNPTPHFSFFKAPINNTKPHKTVNLSQIYKAIKGDHYKKRTQQLRAILDVQQARKFKASNFDYCTFSGIFTTRNDKALVKHSGLLCIDFDHIQSVATLRSQLLKDEYFDTQLLFVSPSGNGIKWIISIDTTATPHRNYFTAIANYIKQTYAVEVDKSGRDTSRACFLSFDPQAFINPIYLKQT